VLLLAVWAQPALAQAACIPEEWTFDNYDWLPSGGWTGTVTVYETNPPCVLTVTSAEPWLTISAVTSDGFTYTAAPNTTFWPRRARIDIGPYFTEVAQLGLSIEGTPGHAGLVWHNVITGAVETWTMNGSTMVEAYALRPARQDTVPGWNLVGRANLNADGAQDLVWQNRIDGHVIYWRMVGAAAWGSDVDGALYGLTLTPDMYLSAVADMDGDGVPDLVFQNRATGELLYAYMQREGTDSYLRRGYASPSPGRVADLDWHIVGAMDSNRDGWTDLVWQHATRGYFAVWLMQDQTLLASEYLDPWRTSDPQLRIAEILDVDGDGNSDFLMQHEGTGALSIWLMNGLRRTAVLAMTPDARSAGWHPPGARAVTSPAVTDLTGDGYPDLLLNHDTTGLLQALMLGRTPPSRTDIVVQPDSNWHYAACADFDGDGHADLLWQHPNGDLSVTLLNGTTVRGTADTSPGSNPDPSWFVAAAYDVNGDGSVDIVWQHPTTGALMTWLMRGLNRYDVVTFATDRWNDPSWRIVGAADFNGDGLTDLLWWHPIDGWLQAWYMNGTTRLSSIMLEPNRVANTNWQPRGVADVNRDGLPDIVWEQIVTGEVQVWYLNRVSLIESVWLLGSTWRLSPGEHIAGVR